MSEDDLEGTVDVPRHAPECAAGRAEDVVRDDSVDCMGESLDVPMGLMYLRGALLKEDSTTGGEEGAMRGMDGRERVLDETLRHCLYLGADGRGVLGDLRLDRSMRGEHLGVKVVEVGHEVVRGGGGGFEGLIGDEITDGLIDLVSEPSEDWNWAVGDRAGDAIEVVRGEVQFSTTTSNEQDSIKVSMSCGNLVERAHDRGFGLDALDGDGEEGDGNGKWALSEDGEGILIRSRSWFGEECQAERGVGPRALPIAGEIAFGSEACDGGVSLLVLQASHADSIQLEHT